MRPHCCIFCCIAHSSLPLRLISSALLVMACAPFSRQSSRLIHQVLPSICKPAPSTSWRSQSLLCNNRPFHYSASVSHSRQLSNAFQAPLERKQQQPLQRTFSTTSSRSHGHLDAPKPGQERKVTFVDKEGDEHTYVVADGDNLLDIGMSQTPCLSQTSWPLSTSAQIMHVY